jgi:hypothetical protein
MVHGSWFMVHGSWLMVDGLKFQSSVLRLRYKSLIKFTVLMYRLQVSDLRVKGSG